MSGLHIVPEHLHQLRHDIKMEDLRQKFTSTSLSCTPLRTSRFGHSQRECHRLTTRSCNPSSSTPRSSLSEDRSPQHPREETTDPYTSCRSTTSSTTWSCTCILQRHQVHGSQAAQKHRTTTTSSTSLRSPQAIRRTLQLDRSDWDITDTSNITDLNTKARDFLHQSAATPLGAHQSLRDSSTPERSARRMTSEERLLHHTTFINLTFVHLRFLIFRKMNSKKFYNIYVASGKLKHNYNKRGQGKAHQLTSRIRSTQPFLQKQCPQHRHQQDAQEAQDAHHFQHFQGLLLLSYEDWCQEWGAHP